MIIEGEEVTGANKEQHGVSSFFFSSSVYLACLKFSDCLVGVWRVHGNCLEGVWQVSDRCLKGACV